uniref:Uncharacterized protein n=1 Tax=Sphaerodactylus townsendi TaxID=933632 RepID=A0ACB8G890_9SAUR
MKERRGVTFGPCPVPSPPGKTNAPQLFIPGDRWGVPINKKGPLLWRRKKPQKSELRTREAAEGEERSPPQPNLIGPRRFGRVAAAEQQRAKCAKMGAFFLPMGRPSALILYLSSSGGRKTLKIGTAFLVEVERLLGKRGWQFPPLAGRCAHGPDAVPFGAQREEAEDLAPCSLVRRMA